MRALQAQLGCLLLLLSCSASPAHSLRAVRELHGRALPRALSALDTQRDGEPVVLRAPTLPDSAAGVAALWAREADVPQGGLRLANVYAQHGGGKAGR